jgi:hypothetical protein
LQQLSARENISPDNFSVHGKYDAYHILIAKLADDTFVVARYRFDHGVNLFLNFTSLLSEQHAMVAGGVQLHVLVFLPDLSPIILVFVQGKRDPSARGQRLSCLITHGPPNLN